jgi:hypothetical protein
MVARTVQARSVGGAATGMHALPFEAGSYQSETE